VNVFGGASGDAWGNLEYITAALRQEAAYRNPVQVVRGSATELPYDDAYFDAVVTDPPYYDNESYSELSDVCYVWLRVAIGFLYPEHFAGQLTPKKKECVAAAYRQGGKQAARTFYEDCMFRSLQEAHRVTKAGGVLIVVYAHKTTLGWATLVEALRRAGYVVTEAWPLDTETKARVAHRGDAALASSIFLVARRREETRMGKYEEEVARELDTIVGERVSALWDMGVSGADLVIACVGAGLRAFTRFGRVEFANGDEVPAERFLTEVETAVLERILARLSREVGGNGGRHGLAGVDSATRFYTLWRYTYKAADLDPGEAIVFANGTHVELDGVGGLTAGPRSLVEKKNGKYRLRDYRERGDEEKLGLPAGSGDPAPIIDVLHRTLWLMENRPIRLAKFLLEAQPNREQMRLVAQALAGPALKGGELSDVSPNAELSALAKLTANWRNLIEEAVMTPEERGERKTGQKQLDFEKEGRR
jgi:putative DNA methylase